MTISVPDTPTGIAFLYAVLGVTGTLITQLIKKISGANGQLALGLTTLTSLAMSWGIVALQGNWHWAELANSTFAVFSLATIAYRLLLSPDAIVTVPTILKT